LQDARDVLWRYARLDDSCRYRTGSIPREDHDAVLGLLHLECEDIREEMESTIRRFCKTDTLFPEYLPALAAKTRNPELLDVIWERGGLGEIEFIGGFVLGVALYGDAGRQKFQDLIWSPKWWGATDTDIYDGMCVLQIAVPHVFEQFKRRMPDLANPLNRLGVIGALIRYRLLEWHTNFRFAPYPPGTCVELYDRVFAQSPGSIVDVALELTDSDPLFRAEYELLEQLTEGAVREELLLNEIRPR
jgi:hypothetical protein